MNKKESYGLCYFLGRTFFLGFGYSLLLTITSKDSWISFLLGTLLGIIFVSLIAKIKEDMQEKTWKEYIQQKKNGKWILSIIYFLFLIWIMIQILFILETFVSSFFLIESPPYYILLPILFIIIRMNKNSFQTIGYLTNIFMPLSFLILLFTIIILIPYSHIDPFLPIMTTKTSNLFLSSLYFAFYSTTPFLLLLDVPLKETKLVRKYVFSMMTILSIGILIIAVLGPNLIEMYRYPEYMLLKKIKIFEFLEKIENIISITWIIDAIFTLAVCTHNLKNILPTKGKNGYLYGIMLFLYGIVIYLGKIYYIELQIYHILPLTLGILSLSLIILLHLFPKKNTT